MNEKLSQKDYELINSYLDQELDRKDVVKFAERMGSDPAISQEVAELMQVKAMVKELPTVTPPRNYILTRAMAEEARPKPFWERLFPVFRTAAAFCALALAFTFIFPLIQQQNKSSSADQQAAYVESAAEVMLKEESADMSARVWDQEIVLEDRDFGGAVEETYNAVMPSYGVRGGNPRIEYLMQQEEKQNALAKSVQLDPENPPEGFISIQQAQSRQQDLILKLALGLGLILSIVAIFFLRRKKESLEVK